jgi:hypothetical protein
MGPVAPWAPLEAGSFMDNSLTALQGRGKVTMDGMVGWGQASAPFSKAGAATGWGNE